MTRKKLIGGHYMSACIDLTGKRFGKLTVIKRVENTAANKAQWLCRCDCGEEIIAISSPLKTGKKTCCPKCSRNKPYLKDLTGQRFGRLTVLGYDEEYTEQQNKIHTQRKTYWKCKCDCGNITYAITASLNNGSKQSCGCLMTEVSRENMKEIQKQYAQTRIVDLTGQRFGKLVVIGKDKAKSKHGELLWKCKCDCGNEKIISGNALKRGNTKSCGCLGRSVGEWIIENWLTKNGYLFIREYTFSDLKDKSYLRYDFAIVDLNANIRYLIEYDGRQHSDKSSQWYSDDLVRKDKMKTQYARIHNIPLLRISYKDQEHIDEILGNF